MSSPLSSGVMVASAALPDDRVCPHCRRWELGADDSFCASCGRLQIGLVLEPDSLIFVPESAPVRQLKIHNRGTRERQVRVVPPSMKPVKVAIEPAAAFALPPGEERVITFSLVEGGLAAGDRTLPLIFRCEVDGRSDHSLPLPITIRKAAMPRLSLAELDFGELAEGTERELMLRVGNVGGLPLKLEAASAIGTPQLRLGAMPKLPRTVLPDAQLDLPVVWDSRREDARSADGKIGLKLRFLPSKQEIFVPAKAKLVKLQARVDRPRIVLEPALQGQDYVERLRVNNAGTAELHITGVESAEPWIEVLHRQGAFTLTVETNEPSSVPREGEGAVFEFEIAIHPQALAPGRHAGRVRVLLAGLEPLTVEVQIHVVSSRPSPEFLGIDFGTTNSVIAFYNAEKREIEVLHDGDSPLIPSVLAFAGSPDVYHIGREALAMEKSYADSVVRSIKRVLGSETEREICGRRFRAVDLAGLILKRLVELAQARIFANTGTYFDLSRAILTVPASFYDVQIRALLEACERAGLETNEELAQEIRQQLREALGEEVRAGVVLDEPSAAALCFLAQQEELEGGGKLRAMIRRKSGLNLLIYDHGGGTLDLCVVNVRALRDGSTGLRFLDVRADATVGGEMFDAVLAREMLASCRAVFPPCDETLFLAPFQELDARREREGWTRRLWVEVLAARGEWQKAAEGLKIELSTRAEAQARISPELIFGVEGGELRRAKSAVTVTVARARFEELTSELLKRSFALVSEALAGGRLTPAKVDYLLHVGRQSLMPALRERLREAVLPKLPVSRDIRDDRLLKVCVAQGAALYGRLQLASPGEPGAGLVILGGGRQLPYGYGLERQVGMLQLEYRELIPRGTPYPSEHHISFEALGLRGSGRQLLRFYQNRGTSVRIRGNPDLQEVGHFEMEPAGARAADGLRLVLDGNRRLSFFLGDQPMTLQSAPPRGEESWLG